MRILKKSLSLLLAIAMIASLIVVNVSAADPDVEYVMEITPSTVKTGQSVTLNVYLREAGGADSVVVNAAAYVINYDPEVFEATNKAISGNPFATNRNATAKTISAIKSIANGDDTDNVTINKDEPIQTVTLKALKAVEEDEAITFSFKAGASASTYADGSSAYVVKQDSTATVTIKPSFVATVATLDGEVDAVKAGTAKDTVIATLASKTATVATGADSAAEGYKSESGYATAGWDCADYNAEVPGEYTFTGKVTADESKAGGWEGDLAVTKKVTVTALGDADTEVAITTNAEALKVKQGDVVADVAALAKAAVTKIEFKGNGLTREIATDAAGITFTQAAEITGAEEVGTEIAVTVAMVDVDSTDNLFVDIDHEETIKVVIVPAEIEDCEIEIKDTTASSKPTVTATIPANEVTGEAAVSVEFLKPVTVDETTTWEVVATETATVTAEADAETVVVVTASKTLDEMGFKNPDDVFAVKVLVNGATLLVDGAESKVMVRFSDNVGGIGVSQGNVSVVAPSKPGTEEPGTEEPGTEEPGTEEPGTEEPGTDAPVVDAPFADITEEYAWAVEAITTLKDLGVINGKDDNNFAPDADITRAEFTKMVAVLFGLEVGAVDTHFADCAADAWYTPYIVAATEAGFINGVNDAEFAPDATITREQACTILGRALKVAGEAELTFTDAAEVADYAKAAIAALAEMGIVNGYEDGSFAPVNNITRAEAAKIMAGAYAKIDPAEEAVAE